MHMVVWFHRRVPLCLMGDMPRNLGGAQLEGEPEETEDKEEQCGPFQRRRRRWVETRVSCLENGRTRSLSGRSRLWILLLLVFGDELGGWPCGEWDVFAVVHRRRRQL